MGGSWHSTDAVMVTVAEAAIPITGLDWVHAVASLPSIDSPDMQTWINRQHTTTDQPDHTVVTPNDIYPDRLRPLPHRQICVPPSEYATFTALLTERERHATTTRTAPDMFG